jgi:hypothetical protein
MMKQLIGIMIPIAFFFMAAACASQEQHAARETDQEHSTDAAGSGKNRMASDARAPRRTYVPGQVLVKFRSGIGVAEVERIRSEAGLETLQVVSAPHLYLMKITDGSAVEDMLARLRKYPEIVYAEPNYVRSVKGD